MIVKVCTWFFIISLCGAIVYGVHTVSTLISQDQPTLTDIRATLPAVDPATHERDASPTAHTEPIFPAATTSRAWYISITGSCGPSFEGTCVHAYAHTDSDTLEPALALRNGMILQVDAPLVLMDRLWFPIVFNEWIRYPERLTSPLYVPVDSATFFTATSSSHITTTEHATTTSKRITIDISTQTLYAQEGSEVHMILPISSGMDVTPTPLGTFTIFLKTPSRYMQGPLPGINTKTYDLPGVPWNMYFTAQGAAIHGAYWHTKFGQQWSSGCINLTPDSAQTLYHWADLGTTVIVRE